MGPKLLMLGGSHAARSFAVTRLAALSVASALLLATCTGNGESPPRDGEAIPRGGTLAVSLVPNPFFGPLSLDPQRYLSTRDLEILRCCLLRTLLSYNGRPTEEGGAVLRLDLAEELPEVSPNGLTWTFRLKQGLTYAPPLEDVEITSSDIVRALLREAETAGPGEVLYAVIEGFSAVVEERAQSISGLETPDDHTLVVHLTKPTGDLGHRLSLPETAPLPPGRRAHPLGVAEGHGNYGRYLVSSGPYMVEGSEDLDFARSPDDQESLSGFDAKRFLTLVRNPAWRRATDPLRPAYVDEIRIRIGGTAQTASDKVTRGTSDVVWNVAPPPQIPLDVVDRYQRDPKLRDRLMIGLRDIVRYISLNLATPPLDDIHVRRALNYAIDKARLLELRGGSVIGEPAGHIILDSLENNLLLNYDPYGSPGAHGDLDAARAEMARSRYDGNGDGRCDAPECEGLRALVLAAPDLPNQRFAHLVAEDFAAIGIRLDVEIPTDPEDFFDRIIDPETRTPVAINPGVFKVLPSASDYLEGLFSSAVIGTCCNFSLVGATRDQLRRWGYGDVSVPSIDEKLAECAEQVGDAAFRCAAEADQLVMEKIVPWVPLVFERQVAIVSERVVNHSFDQLAGAPAFDHFAVSGSGK